MQGYIRSLCVVAAFFSTFSIGHAASDKGLSGIDPHVLISDLKSLGAPSTEIVNTKNCTVKINFDQYDIIQNIPTFRSLGFISQKLGQSYYASHVSMTLIVLSFEVASYRTLALFSQHKSVDNCKFTEYMSKIDRFGKYRKQKLFSYVFSRGMYLKIDWNNFITENLPKVSKKFVFFPNMNALIADAAAENGS